ncbi:hypothetical protein ACSBR1_002484 [Camellia fascicularis]
MDEPLSISTSTIPSAASPNSDCHLSVNPIHSRNRLSSTTDPDESSGHAQFRTVNKQLAGIGSTGRGDFSLCPILTVNRLVAPNLNSMGDYSSGSSQLGNIGRHFFIAPTITRYRQLLHNARKSGFRTLDSVVSKPSHRRSRSSGPRIDFTGGGELSRGGQLLFLKSFPQFDEGTSPPPCFITETRVGGDGGTNIYKSLGFPIFILLNQLVLLVVSSYSGIALRSIATSSRLHNMRSTRVSSVVVSESWTDSSPFLQGAKMFVDKVAIWNQNTFGNIFFQKKKLANRILGIQKSLDSGHSQFLFRLEESLISDYNRILHLEEEF